MKQKAPMVRRPIAVDGDGLHVVAQPSYIREEFAYFLYFLRHNPTTLVGVVLALGFILLIVIAPLITPFGPEEMIPAHALQAPSMVHFFGTDASGLDVYSRVVYAARIDLTIALIATGLALAIGVPLGAIAGYLDRVKGIGGILTEVLMRAMDVIQAFPVFILTMALVAALGPNAFNVILAVAFVNAPVFLRLIRGEVLAVREKPFVEAARCLGNSDLQIVLKHVLPNSLGPALIQASVTMGWAILLTAGLSFVGAGVSMPTAEWGIMISVGARNLITGEWWPALFPGIALGLAVLGFALVGDGLQLFLDPTRRR